MLHCNPIQGASEVTNFTNFCLQICLKSFKDAQQQSFRARKKKIDIRNYTVDFFNDLELRTKIFCFQALEPDSLEEHTPWWTLIHSVRQEKPFPSETKQSNQTIYFPKSSRTFISTKVQQLASWQHLSMMSRTHKHQDNTQYANPTKQM